MSVLLYTLGVLAFALALVVSIGLHEIGHMVPAKKFGAKVTQYFVGFGPTVWSKQVGETEYGVKAIPLGGFVKIIGMLPPGTEALAQTEGVDEDGNPVHRIRKSNTGMFTQIASDARAAEWELIGPEDTDRLFYRLPWWKKVIVMAGGPLVNLAIAFVIFAGIFATYGNTADLRVEPVVASVSACVVPAEENNRLCTDEDPLSPARAAGIEVGDEIVSFNGVEATSWRVVQEAVRANDDGDAEIVVRRDGELLTLTTNTTVAARPGVDGTGDLTQVGFLGVTPTQTPTTGGIGYTLGEMGHMTVNTLEALVQLPVKVWGVAKAIVGVEERDPLGPVSVVGGGRLAGEVVSTTEAPATDRVVFLLTLIAGFNFFIGMFNFVPLLPLDGGHIAGALYEAVRRGVAKLLRRPDPGHFDVAKLMPVAYVVGVSLMVMGVVLIVGDLVVPVRISG